MARKYFRFLTQDLEALFRKEHDNIEILSDLREELTHRKTKKATSLCNQVEKRLDVLRSTKGFKEKTLQKVLPLPVDKNQESPATEQEVPPILLTPSAETITLKPTPQTEFPNAPWPDSSLPINQPEKIYTNQPENILSAWTALEVLSPIPYDTPDQLAGAGNRVSKFDGVFLPWERGIRSLPGMRLYYQIVLGSIKMEPAIERLTNRYGDSREEKPHIHGKAVLAVVVVDHKGRLVESPAVGISSFGWGVITALKGDLADLARWSEIAPQLVQRIESLLVGGTVNEQNETEPNVLPLTRTAIFAAHDTLVNVLGLPREWVEPPEFAIRSYVYYKDPNPPEPLLLNSFFLNDLAQARQLFSEGQVPDNLARYLGAKQPQPKGDLLHDSSVLAEACSPSLTPLSRWPGQGRFPLVLLQQAAVNLAFDETKSGGLLGINGPPGTGKTTLLRDLVAGIVTERAEAMAKFNDPEKAFEHSGQKLKAGNGWIHLYRLNNSLRGFEMVVASSNNKAVENISAELPGLGAIDKDALDLRYFKTLSDSLHQSETWGAIAAVLGNAQNRGRFKQAFWWNDDSGFNSYLCAAAGTVREISIKHSETGQVEHRIPNIVQQEHPPSTHEVALVQWEKSRKRFLEALGRSRQYQTWLAGLHADLARLPVLAQTEAEAASKRDVALETVNHIETIAATARQAETEAKHRIYNVEEEIQIHNTAKPGFWSRLFRTRIAREWSKRLALLHNKNKEEDAEHKRIISECQKIDDKLRQALLQKQATETGWKTACTNHQQVKQYLAEAQQNHGIILVDDNFFTLEHKKRHQSTPWFPKEAQRLREDLFTTAITMHRAFIDVAAKPLRHNLGALMNVFTTQTLPSAEKQALLSDLWGSLFLVVPLLSTTFASVNRMLGKLPIESLGWLFVDEAGQALPQAAVGALMRTRRAVIVGDPVQVEPVVVLPETLTHSISQHFGVDPDHYVAPSASVQTLADAASAYKSEFQTKVGSRSVGVPLLVHRRCSEPMFGISNTIAYSGLMVLAKSPKPSAIRDVLGSSNWIHVQGSGENKWCHEEGEEVLRLLHQLAQAGVKPDIYIITPFVIVAKRLRQAVRESGVLQNWIEDEEWRWTNERIGTIHTVQGREADAVILVLGAPLPTQSGARGWAGGRPNLLNVAVTRAKEVIYVVGNRHLWRDVGWFRELDKHLPPL